MPQALSPATPKIHIIRGDDESRPQSLAITQNGACDRPLTAIAHAPSLIPNVDYDEKIDGNLAAAIAPNGSPGLSESGGVNPQG